MFSLSNYNYRHSKQEKKTVGDEFIYICLVELIELIAHTNYAFMVWKACDSFTNFHMVIWLH